MPNSVILVISVELALVFLTTFLLVKPKQFPGLKWRNALVVGMLFCWSIVTGVILSMNDLVIRL